MSDHQAIGEGTKESPWVLKTPPGTADYTLYKDESRQPPILVCTVGTTVLHYDLRCIEDLHAMLKAHGDWMELGSADEQKEAKEGDGGGVGTFPREPHRRLVWAEEGAARALRHVYPAVAGSAGAGGA
jgi:hypothetical protein